MNKPGLRLRHEASLQNRFPGIAYEHTSRDRVWSNNSSVKFQCCHSGLVFRQLRRQSLTMPWKKLLACVTGQIDEVLRQKLEFVLEENRVYRALLARHSPHWRLQDAERKVLAETPR
jgi:hypothetical protein